MKTLKLLALLLILFFISGCCFNNDCSGWVNRAVEIQFIDKTTDKPLNASAFDVKCVLEGAPMKLLFRTDSSRVRFAEGTFSKQGTYNGTVEVNKQVIGKFAMVLKAYPCCDDYPESGEVFVTEGNLLVKIASGGFDYGNKIGGGNDTQFIVKL